MKGYQYIAFALGLFALVGLAGCEADDVPGGSPEGTGRKVPVTIRLAMEDVGDVATKSGTAEVVNEDWKINTLKVQISAEGEETINLTQDNFSFSGEGETYQGISIEEKKVSLTIGKTYTVKAIANANDLEYTATSINAIRLITAENGVPMSAQDTWIIDANTETKEIKMVRMVAKMNVKITDERGEASNATISSFKISNLLPATTGLYPLENYTVSGLSEWTWAEPKMDEENMTSFYLHETDGTYTVSMELEGEDRVRSNTFKKRLPRNNYFTLNVILSDFALKITGTYELAAVGTEAFEGNIDANLSGYTVNLPEGCSNIQMKIELVDNRSEKPDPSPTYLWEIKQEEGTLPNFTISQDENGSLSLNRLSAIPTKGTKTLHLTTTYGGILLSFDVTINVRSLVDDEWTKSTTPTAPAPIIVEL